MNSRRSSLLLTEIILVVAIFAVSAAVCLRLFAAAYEKSEYAENLRFSAIAAQNAAERLKAADGDLTQMELMLDPRANSNRETAQSLRYQDGRYQIVVTIAEVSGINCATASIAVWTTDADAAFYTLDITIFTEGGGLTYAS